jgi:hypothetical protein
MYVIGTTDGHQSNQTVTFIRQSDPNRPTDPNLETIELSESMAQIHLTKLRTDAFVVSDAAGTVGYVREVQKISYSDQDVLVSTVPVASNMLTSIAQVYLAAFRRAPETEGFHYWTNEVTMRGIVGTADTIFNIDSVKTIYPTSMTPTDFVTQIYHNVFDRTPDSGGLAYWTGQLNSKSRGQLVLDMTNAALGTPEGTLGKDFFENRLDWSLYAVNYQESHTAMTPEHLTTLTDTVGENPTTALKLIGQGEANVLA